MVSQAGKVKPKQLCDCTGVNKGRVRLLERYATLSATANQPPIANVWQKPVGQSEGTYRRDVGQCTTQATKLGQHEAFVKPHIVGYKDGPANMAKDVPRDLAKGRCVLDLAGGDAVNPRGANIPLWIDKRNILAV
jgi:hypothetical protein